MDSPIYQAFTHDVTVPQICPGSDQIFATYQGLDPGHTHESPVYIAITYTGIPWRYGQEIRSISGIQDTGISFPIT